MSHKTRRAEYMRQKTQERRSFVPVTPFEAVSGDALSTPQLPDLEVAEMTRQQRRAADLLDLSLAQSLAASLRQRQSAQQQALMAPPPSTIWETQALLTPVFQELQYRELYQIHKALNGGVYLP